MTDLKDTFILNKPVSEEEKIKHEHIGFITMFMRKLNLIDSLEGMLTSGHIADAMRYAVQQSLGNIQNELYLSAKQYKDFKGLMAQTQEEEDDKTGTSELTKSGPKGN